MLVLGAGKDQCPGLKTARDKGLYVIALDGNPEAIGQSMVDEFYCVNIKSPEAVLSFLSTNVLHDKSIAGVIAFGIDNVVAVATAGDFLGVNHTVALSAAEIVEDKFLAKEMMCAAGVPIPPYAQIRTINDVFDFVQQHGLPIVIKPVDNSAARGVSYVDHIDQIECALKTAWKASKKDVLIIEKFLSGPQISSESLIIAEDVHHIAYADRNYRNVERYFPCIIEDGGELPSVHMNAEHEHALTESIKNITQALSLKNAVFKGDLVIHEGQLFIIEFALRLSGGHFSSLEIPASTGIDLLSITIDLHMNQKIDLERLQACRNKAVCIRYKFVDKPGIVQQIHVPKLTENVIYQMMYVEKGDAVSAVTDHSKRLGVVITEGDNITHAVLHAQQVIDAMDIVVVSVFFKESEYS